MITVTLNLPDEKLRRLDMVARARGTSVAQLFDEMSNAMIAEADAETRFQLRTQRGMGREARGIELLGKAAGKVSSASPPGKAG